MTVQVTVSSNYVVLSAPYHPWLPDAARGIGGKWDAAGKRWRFDARDEDRVRELARKIYGTDGSATETVTIRVKVDGVMDRDDARVTDLYVAGRQIARVFGRDSGAKLGDGVIVVSGGFASGGSRARPELVCYRDTIIEMRDVPTQAAHDAIAHYGADVVQIVCDAKIDREALEAERERLLARLAEIDALLNG